MPQALCATRFLVGIGQGCVDASIVDTISRWSPSEERSRASGFTFNGYNIGMVIGKQSLSALGPGCFAASVPGGLPGCLGASVPGEATCLPKFAHSPPSPLIGLLLGPWLCIHFGWRSLFHAFGALGAVWCAWWMAYVMPLPQVGPALLHMALQSMAVHSAGMPGR